MSTETRRVMTDRSVTVCDRCGKHTHRMYKAKMNLHPGPGMGDPLEYEGDLCEPCALMMHRRIQAPTKRTRKAVADAS